MSGSASTHVWAHLEKCIVNAYPREDVKGDGLWAECGVCPHEADSSREAYAWKIIDLRNLPACHHERVPEFQRTAYDLKSKGGSCASLNAEVNNVQPNV